MPAQHTQVAFFTCGGTIDKIYFDAKSAYSIGDPCIPTIAKRARAALPPPQILLKKDSLNMTDKDRKTIANAVAASPAARAVITHGTDTMAETARVIAVHPAAKNKTVVLVGAFLPAVFRESDADFNLGFAVAAALCLPAGVYVAMNGKILPAASVKKMLPPGVSRGRESLLLRL